MSRTKRYNRSSVSSVRALSGSDTEEDSSNIDGRLLVRKRAQSSTDSKLNYSTRRKTLSEVGINSHSISNENVSRNNIYSSLNNHSSNFSHGNTGVDSFSSDSLQHISTVQNSTFDRFRWFLWSCTYLKIITNVNFDVWFLSRLHKYGKYKAIFIFLLPLLLLLLWGLMQSDSHASFSAFFSTLNSGLSSIIMYLTALFSRFGRYFVQEEEVVVNVKSEEEYCSPVTSGISTILSTLSGVAGFFSGLFVRSEESSSSPFVSHTTSQSSASYQPSKEEVKVLIMEVLSKEVSDLQRILKVSSAQHTQTDKSEKDKQLQNEIRKTRLEFQTLSENVKEFEKGIIQQIEKSSSSEETISILTAEHNNHIDLLSTKLKDIEEKLAILETLKKCCDQTWTSSDFAASLETHLTAALKNIIGGDSKSSSPYHFFNTWLTSKFIDRKKLSEEIDAAVMKFKTNEKSVVNQHDTMKIVENVVQNYAESLKTNLSQMNNALHFNTGTISEEFVKKVVKEAIMLYDADKTGLVDYALESGGGSVLGTRCSETYVEKNGKFRIFGLPFWSNNNSPRTAIQPGVQPGECWAFQGSQGFLVLELSATVYPTGFTMEHIPVSISPSGSIDSAPKDFSVWGLKSENDKEGILFGKYTYDASGDPMQYFAVQHASIEPFSIMELKINSNHGNLEYTCLYRFRVHGKRAGR